MSFEGPPSPFGLGCDLTSSNSKDRAVARTASGGGPKKSWRPWFTWSVAALSLVLFPACQLLGYFDQAPPDRCEVPGGQEQLPCGPCLKGLQLRVCGQNHLWHREGACLGNLYDLDQDGFANSSCFDEEDDDACCGEADCDDTTAERYPGHGDVDRDEHIDVRCGGDDCDDDNDDLWNGHADRDGDGFNDVDCGGIDCDDFNALRWTGHADVDGDGHTDLRCCTDNTPLCDDCNDDDPQRWLNHADLDWDGHDDINCCDADGSCGDDCDDMHPLRWMGHADVDGDGRVDDRCCPGCDVERLDCNDNDPRRWTGNSDLDGDGRHDARCRCDDVSSPVDCELFDDCDDDCVSCYPEGERSFAEARDHDCNAIIDELEYPGCTPDIVEVIGYVDTGDSHAVAVAGDRVFVGSTDGVFIVDVESLATPVILDHLDIGAVRDIAIWGDTVVAASPAGILVLGWTEASGLVRLAGPVAVGDARSVTLSGGLAFVGTSEGLFVVDLALPTSPVVVLSAGSPLMTDVRDVIVFEGWSRLSVLCAVGATADFTRGGLVEFDMGADLSLSVISSLELPGAHRLDVGCDHSLAAVATDNTVGIMKRFNPILLPSMVELEGVTGIDATCSGDLDVHAYVSTREGLVVMRSQDTIALEAIQDVALGSTRSVVSLGGVLFVATTTGLSVLTLDCENVEH